MLLNPLKYVLSLHFSNSFKKKCFWGYNNCITRSNFYHFAVVDCIQGTTAYARIKLILGMI